MNPLFALLGAGGLFTGVLLAADTLPVPAQLGVSGFCVSLALALYWTERKDRIKAQDRLFAVLERSESTTVPSVNNMADVLRELQGLVKDAKR